VLRTTLMLWLWSACPIQELFRESAKSMQCRPLGTDWFRFNNNSRWVRNTKQNRPDHLGPPINQNTNSDDSYGRPCSPPFQNSQRLIGAATPSLCTPRGSASCQALRLLLRVRPARGGACLMGTSFQADTAEKILFYSVHAAYSRY